MPFRPRKYSGRKVYIMDAAIKGLGSIFITLGEIDSGHLGFVIFILLVVWAVSRVFNNG